MPIRIAAVLALFAASALAFPTWGEETPPAAAQAAGPIGITLTASLAGGGSLVESGLFEGEITVGYEVGSGIRPDFGLVLGLAPGTYVALRPGVYYSFPELPVYARAALDIAYPHGEGKVRWLLLGAGLELKLTGLYGIFAEGDTGIPLSKGAGLPLELRAGVNFHF